MEDKQKQNIKILFFYSHYLKAGVQSLLRLTAIVFMTTLSLAESIKAREKDLPFHPGEKLDISG